MSFAPFQNKQSENSNTSECLNLLNLWLCYRMKFVLEWVFCCECFKSLGSCVGRHRQIASTNITTTSTTTKPKLLRKNNPLPLLRIRIRKATMKTSWCEVLATKLFLLKASFQCQFTSARPVRVNWSITFTNHSAENTAVWGPVNCIPPTKEMPPSSCHTSQLLAPEWLQSSRTLHDKQSCH